MKEGDKPKLSKFGQVNQFIRILAGVIMGSIIYYPPLTIFAYVLLRILPSIAKQDNSNLDQQSQYSRIKLIKVAEGAVLGSFTGFVALPIAAILLTLIIDKRLKVNKKAFYIKGNLLENTQSQSPLVFLSWGSIFGNILLFTDLWLVSFIAKIAILFSLIVFHYQEGSHEDWKKFSQNQNFAEFSQFKKGSAYKESSQLLCLILGGCLGLMSGNLLLFCLSGFYILWLLASSHLMKNPEKIDQVSVIQPSEEAYKKLTRAEEELACPISSVIMANPKFLKQCGHTFDGKQIEQWLSKKDSCPLCNTKSETASLKTNIVLRDILQNISSKDE